MKKHSAEVTACLYTLWGEGGELLFLTIWYRKYIMTDETIDLDELDKRTDLLELFDGDLYDCVGEVLDDETYLWGKQSGPSIILASQTGVACHREPVAVLQLNLAGALTRVQEIRVFAAAPEHIARHGDSAGIQKARDECCQEKKRVSQE